MNVRLRQVRRKKWGTCMKVSSQTVIGSEGTPFNCPVEATLDVIGGKWKVVVLFYLTRAGTHRFAELRRKIAGVSERMLTQQLRELEEDGIVHRKVYPVVPPRVEYSLTPYGRTLAPISELMCRWGKKHLSRLKEHGG